MPGLEVQRLTSKCGIRDYSINIRNFPDGKHELFSHFEQDRDDIGSEMERMPGDPEMQRPSEVCQDCQYALADRKVGKWWSWMDELFHPD